MMRLAHIAFAIALAAAALVSTSTASAQTVEPPPGTIYTADPLAPVRHCATGADYARVGGAYNVSATVQRAATIIADRPDLAAATLTPSQQDQLATIIVDRLGADQLVCGHAYAACPVTTSTGIWCYTAPDTQTRATFQPGDTFAVVETLRDYCVIPADGDPARCVQRWACTPFVAATLTANGDRVPYSLAVLGGISTLCTLLVPGATPTATPTPAPTPTPTAPPSVPVPQPRPAFTG